MIKKINKKFVVLFLSSLTILLIIYNCAYNPVNCKKELSFMSESMEQKTGEQYYPFYTQVSNGLFPDKELQEYVSQVGNSLLNHPHRRNFKYEFNVINTSVPNAYALPGGKVSITRGLLVKMQNEDQLAGVLGHEIGHINARHTADRYTKTILAQAVLLAGAYYLEKKNVKQSEIYIAAGFFGSQLTLLKYSRDNEREADKLGVEYMVNSGYNPQGYVELMEILKSLHDREPSKLEAFFSTHPLTSERIADAKNLIASQYSVHSSTRDLKTQVFAEKTNILKLTEKAYSTFDEGIALLKNKNYKEAEKKFNDAINQYNKDSLFYSYLSFTKSKLGNYRDALNVAEKAVSLYPDFYIARLVKGIALAELKDYNNAIIELNQANNLVASSNATAAFYLAKSYDEIKDITKAVASYKKVLELTEEPEMVNYAKSRLSILAPEPAPAPTTAPPTKSAS